MSRIVRRYITEQADGTPIVTRSEVVHDDGEGNLRLTERRVAQRCSGCLRHLLDVEHTRGICEVCHVRECCVHCESRCAVCARRLCGQCRFGFAAVPPRSVCAGCYRQLSQRQAVEESLEQNQREFERWIAYQRVSHQNELLHLNQRRLELTEAGRPNRNNPNLLRDLSLAAVWTVRQSWAMGSGIVRHVRRIIS